MLSPPENIIFFTSKLSIKIEIIHYHTIKERKQCDRAFIVADSRFKLFKIFLHYSHDEETCSTAVAKWTVKIEKIQQEKGV